MFTSTKPNLKIAQLKLVARKLGLKVRKRRTVAGWTARNADKRFSFLDLVTMRLVVYTHLNYPLPLGSAIEATLASVASCFVYCQVEMTL